MLPAEPSNEASSCIRLFWAADHTISLFGHTVETFED
jgi:hypothetical protein